MLRIADVGKHVVPGALRAKAEAMPQFDGRQTLWICDRVCVQCHTIAMPGLEVRVPVPRTHSILSTRILLYSMPCPCAREKFTSFLF